jgi:hypothetical protein
MLYCQYRHLKTKSFALMMIANHIQVMMCVLRKYTLIRRVTFAVNIIVAWIFNYSHLQLNKSFWPIVNNKKT